MKTLSFTAIEILPSLLAKSKFQTIRPHEKQRYFPTDKVELVWHARGHWAREQTFCTDTGRPSRKCVVHAEQNGETTFAKVFGAGEITEAFQMYATMFGFARVDGQGVSLPELAVLDGFDSSTEMLMWFRRHYHLDTHKNAQKFWAYRWKWNNSGGEEKWIS